MARPVVRLGALLLALSLCRLLCALALLPRACVLGQEESLCPCGGNVVGVERQRRCEGRRARLDSLSGKSSVGAEVYMDEKAELPESTFQRFLGLSSKFIKVRARLCAC